jgi:predicted dehydrogenase
MLWNKANRREFVAATGTGLAGGWMWAGQAPATGRAIGANDRINVAVIGAGGRGAYVADEFDKYNRVKANSCKVTWACDVYRKRLSAVKQRFDCRTTLDYREVLADKDVDAVIVATPDHWHARIAMEAMEKGKDVYLEKPMCHTVEEVKALISTVNETKRVLQVGSQTTSADQWWKARQAIAGGRLGQMLMSQGSYHRNSVGGEWNWKVDAGAGPEGQGEDYIDWKTWLGPAPKRAFDADRFFRFRKYWDYSGGIATDLFFHVVAPMNICWGEAQYPRQVAATGGIYCFQDEREVPDTFQMVAEYGKGHSLVLSSTMANSEHIPGLIRGHLGTLVMVEHGQFEEPAPYVTVKPERQVVNAEYKAKFGDEPARIQVEDKDMLATHIGNFLDCVRTRQRPTLDVETAARAQVAITMAVESYRRGRVVYFDERSFKVVEKPVKT